MTAIDHRAEAERKLGLIDDDRLAPLLEALVHATLAAGTPIADRHLLDAGASAAGKYRELRQAVQEALALSSGPAPFTPDVPAIERAWDRLRELVR